ADARRDRPALAQWSAGGRFESAELAGPGGSRGPAQQGRSRRPQCSVSLLAAGERGRVATQSAVVCNDAGAVPAGGATTWRRRSLNGATPKEEQNIEQGMSNIECRRTDWVVSVFLRSSIFLVQDSIFGFSFCLHPFLVSLFPGSPSMNDPF